MSARIPDFFKVRRLETLDPTSIEEFSQRLSARDEALIKRVYEIDHPRITNWINESWRWVVDELKGLETEDDEFLIQLTSAIAGLTRNLVAGSIESQDDLRLSIELILRVLWYTSAIVRLEDSRFDLLNRRLLQALANLLTSNEGSIQHTWPYLTEVDERESVLLRLMYSKDQKILMTVAILLINLIKNSPARIRTMYTAELPITILTKMFERLDELLLVQSPAFELIIALIREIFTNQDIKSFYQSQQTLSQPVSPSQLSILKVLESSTTDQSESLNFLLDQLPLLIHRLVGDRSDLEEELNFRLWQAIVLISSTIVKIVEEKDQNEEVIVDLKSSVTTVVKAILNLLRDMPKGLMTVPVEDAQEATLKQRPRSPASQLRIVLIQLLSGLCYLDRRVAQDAIRDEGGLGLVLDFTVLDPDQPYLREHALFLIRNVLLENPENQAVIQHMKKIS